MAPPAREQLLLLQIVPGPGRATRHGLSHSGLASQPERCSHSSGSDRNTAARERGNACTDRAGTGGRTSTAVRESSRAVRETGGGTFSALGLSATECSP